MKSLLSATVAATALTALVDEYPRLESMERDRSMTSWWKQARPFAGRLEISQTKDVLRPDQDGTATLKPTLIHPRFGRAKSPDLIGRVHRLSRNSYAWTAVNLPHWQTRGPQDFTDPRSGRTSSMVDAVRRVLRAHRYPRVR